jgi:hypothetical protein
LKTIITYLFLAISTLPALGQVFNEADFQAPLDIPLYLAGNFAELRRNHFHSGLDLKTQGREGLTIRASASGYISRIKVSAYGYGLALYIDHPNGYTTVYGHMSEFSKEIDLFTKNAQYDVRSFELDLEVPPDALPVEQGQIIGLSGNSGSSGGPHLHFEIRETSTEYPMNPLLWNFDVADDVPPEIRGVITIPLQADGRRSLSGGSSFRTTKQGSTYVLANGPIDCWEGEPVGLALETIDRLSGQSNQCGVYMISLFVDSDLVFRQTMNKLDFDIGRHMNAHTVYDVYRSEHKSLHRSFILPNNKLQIYSPIEHSGIIQIEAGQKRTARYEVLDVHGNESVLTFDLLGKKRDLPRGTPASKAQQDFRFDQVNAYRAEQCSVFLQEGRLFEDLAFHYALADTLKYCLTGTHKVGDNNVPLANTYLLKIKVDIPDSSLWKKAVVVRHNPGNGRFYSEAGRYKRGWMEARPREFGEFSIRLDTIPPSIRNINVSANMKGKASFSVKVSDDLSGIERFQALIDGQWVLLTYDAKNAKMTYVFDESRLSHGEHKLQISVWDERENVGTYESTFTW